MLENNFQSNLVTEIKRLLPGSIIMKNDSSYIQGIPDLTVLHNDKWAFLEVKKSKKEAFRPNQEYYIDKANKMSFARVIYPENKEDVLYELQQAFKL